MGVMDLSSQLEMGESLLGQQEQPCELPSVLWN